MTDFEKKTLTSVGGSVSILRGEYISEKKEFLVHKYQKSLENYCKVLDQMGVIPLDDFYRIGIEHLHELDSEHQEMLLSLKRRADELQRTMLPNAMVSLGMAFADAARQFKEKGYLDEKGEFCLPVKTQRTKK